MPIYNTIGQNQWISLAFVSGESLLDRHKHGSAGDLAAMVAAVMLGEDDHAEQKLPFGSNSLRNVMNENDIQELNADVDSLTEFTTKMSVILK